MNVTSHGLSGSDCISDSSSGSDCLERRVSRQMKMTEWKAIARNLPIRYLYSHHVFVALDLLCSCIHACFFPNSHTTQFSIFYLTIFYKRKKLLHVLLRRSINNVFLLELFNNKQEALTENTINMWLCEWSTVHFT